jgi:serine phosphatase RsbU (regulator of sigma subunit)
MTMARFQSEKGSDGESPAKILARLNEIMWNAGTGNVTMTFFAAFIDPRTGIMTYANAGHNFPMILPKDPGDERLAKLRKKKPETRGITLTLGGTPLGFHNDSDYKEKKVQLLPGDRVFLYTDGLIECTNKKEQMWGKTGLVDCLEQVSEKSIQEIRDRTVNDAYKFFAGHPTKDDVTVVVAEMAKDWQPAILDKAA